MAKLKIEPDKEMLVWSLTETTAMAFVGRNQVAGIRVVKEHPEDTYEKEKYHPDAKLFAIRLKPAGLPKSLVTKIVEGLNS